MKLVLDSNIIFAAIIRVSLARKIILHLSKAEFFTISTNYSELEEHKQELIKKSKLNQVEFDLICEQITKKCIIIEDSVLIRNWKNAKSIMDKIDPNDTPFISAALAIGADIWSEDRHLIYQKEIKIWKTSELAKLP